MMTEFWGDALALLERPEYNYLAHGCNCFCTMGAGIAKQIATKYPKALEVDRETTSGDKKKLGTFTVSETDGKHIFNLYTQYDYGKDKANLNIEALADSFTALNQYMVDNKINHLPLLIPRIGAGLAGGKWHDIIRRIDSAAPNLNIIVVLQL